MTDYDGEDVNWMLLWLVMCFVIGVFVYGLWGS